MGWPALWRQTSRLCARHRLFAVLVAGGSLLRLAALAAYWPALEFYGDSYSYLRYARELSPDPVRPFGYSAFLRLFAWSPSLVVVPAVAHLLGLGIGAALYYLSLRRGLPRWLAASAAAPVLLDAYQVDIEQMVMAETLFATLLAAAIVVLLCRARPTVAMSAGAGILLAAATLTRSVALVLGLLAAVYLLARKAGIRRLLAFVLCWAAPLLAYAAWFAAAQGSFALQNVDGMFLWGRVAPFADCARFEVTQGEIPLCSPHPADERPGPNFYDWDRASPRYRFRAFDARTNALFRHFAIKVIVAQPHQYATLVAHDVAHYFSPSRHAEPPDWYLGSWRFPSGRVDPRWHIDLVLWDVGGAAVPRRYDPLLGGLLRGYQSFGFMPGPLLGACALVGVLASMVASGYGSVRARHDCLLLVAMGLALLVVPCATAVFDYRYMLPTLVCLPLAGALGLNQLRTVRLQIRRVRCHSIHSIGRRARGDLTGAGWRSDPAWEPHPDPPCRGRDHLRCHDRIEVDEQQDDDDRIDADHQRPDQATRLRSGSGAQRDTC